MGESRSTCVWVLTTEFSPYIVGGLGTVATELSKAISKENVKVIVWSKSASKQVAFAGLPRMVIIRIPQTKRYYEYGSYKTGSLVSAASTLASRKPDIIHVHSLEYANEALSYKKKHRTPILYTCHSLILSEKTNTLSAVRRKNIQRALILGSDRIVVPSGWLRNQIVQRFPTASTKTIVIPHGVEIPSRITKAPRHELLYVGRLISSKGVDPLVEAAGKLSRNHKKLRLTIVGKGSQKYRRKLFSIAHRKGFASKIRFLGFLPPHNMKRIYASMGIVVVPSKQGESFCLVALEAMANGNPLVSTLAGGLRDFVNHRNAEIIPSVTGKSIAKAIKKVLANPERTNKRIRMARIVANRNRWPDAAKRYIKLFKNLQASTSNRRK
ncbi:glycosyltransferase family 4 protein [Paenibacillus allorhizosphaerae]|uniref:Glycogen synthase n=1 Tax=Paenibacillus allorhizosphaerae TaxID=2849866 RepID=A0ABN7TG97_9BACL|nr:glycosyltransferase family 4 protein [Paenibacillus allorhizosphaerae]CAG7618338.1 Glycogen synthase [Paenibacillus allorhizosphaerae]